MLMTLALLGATTLAPAQDAPKFDNDRFAYGPLGQSRKKGEKFLPGDTVFLVATVKGLTAGNDGMVKYSMGFEVTKKGEKKPVVKHEGVPRGQLNWLGGGDVPVFAAWSVPRDAEAPGDYTMTLTCTDSASKKSATLSKDFSVDKTKLGFVKVGFSLPPIAAPGQLQLLDYSLVGFEFDKKDKKSDVTVTIRVLDEDGKPTVAKPLTSNIKSDYNDSPGIMAFHPARIELNRPGKYKVELTARCNLTRETTKEVLDLTVVEIK